MESHGTQLQLLRQGVGFDYSACREDLQETLLRFLRAGRGIVELGCEHRINSGVASIASPGTVSPECISPGHGPSGAGQVSFSAINRS